MASNTESVRAKFTKDLQKRLEEIGGTGWGLLSKDVEYQPIERMPTGSPLLDKILGGGIPRGQITEIYGPEAGGKTTLCYSIMGQAQHRGEEVVFIDAEGGYNPEWAAKFGVDFDNLRYVAPDSGDKALETVRAFVEHKGADLIVIDSVAALVPEAELKGEIGDGQVGGLPRLMSQALRIMNPSILSSRTAVVFTNQLREKIGIMYGNPETTPGGRALRHYARMKIEARKTDWIKDGDQIVGMKTRYKTVKNQWAPPFQTVEVSLMFDTGFDRIAELVELAIDSGVLTKAGAWISFGENRWQGKDKTVDWFKEHPEAVTELHNQTTRV